MSATGGDCDDVDPLTFPGATEVCNGVDDDCDTVADDGVAPPTWYFDGDGDGYGTPNTTDVGCTATEGYVASGADCNDADPAINPDTLWYPDLDEDGYGDMNSPVASCDQPAGLIRDGTDCDDARGDVSPAGLEVCDAGCTDAGCDEDCDGLVDDEDVFVHATQVHGQLDLPLSMNTTLNDSTSRIRQVSEQSSTISPEGFSAGRLHVQGLAY